MTARHGMHGSDFACIVLRSTESPLQKQPGIADVASGLCRAAPVRSKQWGSHEYLPTHATIALYYLVGSFGGTEPL